MLPEKGGNVALAPVKGAIFLHNLGEATQPHPGGRGLDFWVCVCI